MSDSFTISASKSFTITDARHIAARVATDLKRLQRLYGSPSDGSITDYQTEVTELLHKGYLATVSYGFKRNGDWIEPTLRYTAQELGGGSAKDDDPGRVRAGADITDASFYSYLTYSAAWDKLTTAEQQAFKDTLPVKRGGAAEPSVNGYFSPDRTYSAGDRALNRDSVRSS